MAKESNIGSISNPFLEWMSAVAADGIVVDPNDITAEARGNLWSFSLTDKQAASVTIAEVVEFAEGIAKGRQAWLATHNTRPMVLYWWHDAQAGQLRFSMVSAGHGRLPFACKVEPAASFHLIVTEWLASGNLVELPPNARNESVIEQPASRILRVWSSLLT